MKTINTPSNIKQCRVGYCRMIFSSTAELIKHKERQHGIKPKEVAHLLVSDDKRVGR